MLNFRRPSQANRRTRLMVEVLENRLTPATFKVTTTADVVDPADGVLSLREAVDRANAAANRDTIKLAARTYTSNDDYFISQPVTIKGKGLDRTILDGNQLGRIFECNGAFTVTLIGLRLQNGISSNAGGALHALNTELIVKQCTISGNTALFGGGIEVINGSVTLLKTTVSGNHTVVSDGGGINAENSTVTITNSTISGNTSVANGGGIWSINSTLVIAASIVADNTAAVVGGGMWCEATDVSVTRSTVSGNSAEASAGGIGTLDQTSLTLTDSTVSGNTASVGSGGGILVGGKSSATFLNTTISSNRAGNFGGGLFADISTGSPTTVKLSNVTITDNTATTGGGIYHRLTSGTGSAAILRIANSIVARNFAGSDSSTDIQGDVTSDGHNLIGIYAAKGVGNFDDVFGDLLGTADNPLNPRLGPLQDNGGPTLTHALLPDSPAIDAGDDGLAPTKDQRGFTRRKDGNGDGSSIIDIGAFEK